MKKVLSFLFILTLTVSAVAFTSCGETAKEPTVTESASATGTGTQTETETRGEASAAVSEAETGTEPQSEAESSAAATESSAETGSHTVAEETSGTETEAQPDVPAVPEKSSLKILAIGNSFSVDAMEYVYQIAKQVGYEEVVLGNLYIGGCSLQTHASNLKSKSKPYTYYYNDSGKWQTVGNADISDVIGAAEWDYVSLQQVSGYSGVASSYEPYLTQLINYVKENAPQAEIFWHMTWAYPEGSDYSSFRTYGYDQARMYDSIISAVQEKIVGREEISFVIPVGTAVQNVRTSYFGDNLSRDNLHLSYDVGRYIASMTWVKQISGADIDGVTYIPSGAVTPRLLSTIKEAVNNAYAHPFEITEASDKRVATPGELLASLGIDPANYTRLDLGITYRAYYNSTESSSVISAANGSTASNLPRYACTGIFDKTDLPEGTLIVTLDGYQYRPEGWTSLSSVNASSQRPQIVAANVTVVTEDWWGDWNYRAFNLSKKGNPVLQEAEMAKMSGVFAIFVPNDPDAEIPTLPGDAKIEVDLDKILKDAGYDPGKYEILDYGVTFYAYYYSCQSPNVISKAGGSTASNINQFATTSAKFTKDDIPTGSLIVIADGYQYRPEGWKTLTSTNTSAERPGNVTEAVTEVTEEWWGKWTYRAFNIARAGNPNLSDEQMKELDGVLFILVPKE